MEPRRYGDLVIPRQDRLLRCTARAVPGPLLAWHLIYTSSRYWELEGGSERAAYWAASGSPGSSTGALSWVGPTVLHSEEPVALHLIYPRGGTRALAVLDLMVWRGVTAAISLKGKIGM